MGRFDDWNGARTGVDNAYVAEKQQTPANRPKSEF